MKAEIKTYSKYIYVPTFFNNRGDARLHMQLVLYWKFSNAFDLYSTLVLSRQSKILVVLLTQ